MLDPLPLVARDLPDEASQEVVAAYDRATLFEPQPSRDMLAAAERAIPVPSGFETAWNAWLRDFTSDAADPAPIPDAILVPLRDDPRNADRLSNLAVALYFAVLTEKQTGSEGKLGVEYRFGVANALRLLGATSQVFPDSRAPVLNYVFLSNFYRGFGPSDSAQVADPEAVLAAWSTAHPDDVTALQMRVSGHLSFHDPAFETPMSQLNQLAVMPDAPRAALGHSLLGDLKLRKARAQQARSPFTAQQTAREALQEYDQALARSDDPSIYAARAVTLEFLGDVPAAIESQRRAVGLQPDSVPLRVLLAELYSEQRGDESQVLSAMREARETGREALAIAASQQNPSLGDVQLRVDPELYRGSRRDVDYSAFRPARTYLHLGLVGNVPGGAAAYVISYDLIPEFESEPKVATGVSLPAERAAYNAIIASVILGDPSGAADDTEKLRRLVAGSNTHDGPDGPMTRLKERVIPAARLVADPGISTGFDSLATDFAVTALRYAGLPARAAALCRVALDRPDAARSRTTLLECLGENAYLAGEYDVARQAFAALGYPLYEGFIADVAGDTDDAIRLYQFVASGTSYRGDRGIASARIGDIKIDSGDPAGALEHYDQAIQVLEGSPDGPPAGETESTTLQRVRNNRGVARLTLLARSGSAPDCMGKGATACADALADFEAALRSDPDNPVYLLGKAWVERLQGKSQAAIQTLNQAVQRDPTLFPALNDLGVLAVQSGDLPRASQAFRDALAVNPTYDLALWNIGVLEMQRGVSGVPRGQAYLARAILQNPSFVSSGLSYRTDEGVYRVEFNERLKPGAGWSFASATSVATTTFGLITVLAIILGAIDYLWKDKIQNAASARAADAAAWLDRRVGRRLSLPSGDGRFRWLPILVTLPALAFVTSWSALRENPGTAGANVFLALFAALTAVIAHEAGHALAAWKLNARIRPAQWGPGTLLALVLLPVHLNAGPFPGQRVECEDEGAAWWVYLSGPLANLLVALGACTLFFVQPMPGLRLIAVVQLVAVSYALLPFDPLDGAVLSRSRPMVAGGLASFVLSAGFLFSVGVF